MSQPLVTIGLVVRNGEAHLASAVNSLLSQSFRDFELVIYDNASTDGTAEIARQFAREDRRVKLVRHECDVGVLQNMIGAAERAESPYFCWAAHDDLREPSFLSALADLLDRHPTAALACCAVRNIDPNGEWREIRLETESLKTTTGMSPRDRLRMYLSEAPATPFYGLFRTKMLRPKLDVLRRAIPVNGSDQRAPMLGLDIVLLASIIADHELAITHEPLLLFRRGGLSHRVDAYKTLRGFVAQLRQFGSELRRATRGAERTIGDRLALRWARSRFFCRFLINRPMRLMAWHYLSAALPALSMIHAHWIVRRQEPFARLRRRSGQVGQRKRVVIFGAGKHTRRCLHAMRLALKGHSIIAICDDAALRCEPTATARIVEPCEAVIMRPDVVVISSDAYEAALLHRARDVFPDTPIWCIYDTALETSGEIRSSRSTALMNSLISEITSSDGLVEAAALDVDAAFSDSTNASRM